MLKAGPSFFSTSTYALRERPPSEPRITPMPIVIASSRIFGWGRSALGVLPSASFVSRMRPPNSVPPSNPRSAPSPAPLCSVPAT
jgi:hypothetical protein